jgi:hypothetical protein
MGTRNKVTLGVEHLEVRDTPAVLGNFGGGHSAVALYSETTEAGTTYHVKPVADLFVAAALIFLPSDTGPLRALAGGGNGQPS